jgi:hypothetical protein
LWQSRAEEEKEPEKAQPEGTREISIRLKISWLVEKRHALLCGASWLLRKAIILKGSKLLMYQIPTIP